MRQTRPVWQWDGALVGKFRSLLDSESWTRDLRIFIHTSWKEYFSVVLKTHKFQHEASNLRFHNCFLIRYRSWKEKIRISEKKYVGIFFNKILWFGITHYKSKHVQSQKNPDFPELHDLRYSGKIKKKSTNLGSIIIFMKHFYKKKVFDSYWEYTISH